MMPIGAALGGLIVVLGEHVSSREIAQRLPWLGAGALMIALFGYAGPRLTSAAFAQAREQATSQSG